MSLDTGWFTRGQFMRTIDKGEKRLVVSVLDNDSNFLVVALETKQFKVDWDNPENVAAAAEEVFDNHAHKSLGHAKHPTEALKIADDYIAEWLSGIDPLEACECEEIK